MVDTIIMSMFSTFSQVQRTSHVTSTSSAWMMIAQIPQQTKSAFGLNWLQLLRRYQACAYQMKLIWISNSFYVDHPCVAYHSSPSLWCIFNLFACMHIGSSVIATPFWFSVEILICSFQPSTEDFYILSQRKRKRNRRNQSSKHDVIYIYIYANMWICIFIFIYHLYLYLCLPVYLFIYTSLSLYIWI